MPYIIKVMQYNKGTRLVDHSLYYMGMPAGKCQFTHIQADAYRMEEYNTAVERVGHLVETEKFIKAYNRARNVFEIVRVPI